MPEFDIDAALAGPPVPGCDFCELPMYLVGLEGDGTGDDAGVAVFRCKSCEATLTEPLVWQGYVDVVGGTLLDDRTNLWDCACWRRSRSAYTTGEATLEGGYVHCPMSCDYCPATWTDVFRLEVPRA